MTLLHINLSEHIVQYILEIYLFSPTIESMKKENYLLKGLRATKGITQEQMAARTELNRIKYLRIENGIRSPNKDERMRIAKVLGISPNLVK